MATKDQQVARNLLTLQPVDKAIENAKQSSFQKRLLYPINGYHEWGGMPQ
jgi:hypothetical protein